MAIGEIIRSAVLPIIPICDPGAYLGDEAEYTVYNCTELPDDYGDDAPQAMRYLVQLHWFLPIGVNPTDKKRRLRQALHGAGLTYPTVMDSSTLTAQHFVLECEGCDGDV